MGILWLRYYQGRSMPLQLVFVSLPAIMCLGMLIDIGLSHSPSGGYAAAQALRLVVGAPLLSASACILRTIPKRRGRGRCF